VDIGAGALGHKRPTAVGVRTPSRGPPRMATRASWAITIKMISSWTRVRVSCHRPGSRAAARRAGRRPTATGRRSTRSWPTNPRLQGHANADKLRRAGLAEGPCRSGSPPVAGCIRRCSVSAGGGAVRCADVVGESGPGQANHLDHFIVVGCEDSGSLWAAECGKDAGRVAGGGGLLPTVGFGRDRRSGLPDP
jgi:hypothetical protein